MDDKEWADRLGGKQEVQDAYEITHRSLHIATGAIKAEELGQAREQRLMSIEEIRSLTQLAR